jgi:DNA-binding PucR family transcriptional regulator
MAAESASEVSAALVPRAADVAADIYRLIVQEIPALRGDERMQALLEASVAENVSTMQENGSYQSTAERLVLHKNTVQYRVRKAEESMRRPVGQDRLRIELALLATQWLGPAVLRPVGDPP